ncbi:hypothetical protein JIX56_09035 [Streptomyces sp. CA-210063]|uniref:hypothetical protein n=1 Tax=Streptomyces sp. CA-210063 TaxID=2801029 RepID=UPI00214C8EA9|nr:hypothetical protein [Streptomyces sp. CA-210063]UUU30023.1 hypothetical protein JIX56_09035 [Streptomyces sp. CA-210063]
MDRSHARGIRVIGATLTPYGDHGAYTAAREGVRQAGNASIRGGGIFDAVADWTGPSATPSARIGSVPPTTPATTSTSTTRGMRALADAIDLSDVTP